MGVSFGECLEHENTIGKYEAALEMSEHVTLEDWEAELSRTKHGTCPLFPRF